MVLLDSRVVTKRYGPLLLGGLPRAERVVGTLGAGADQVRGLLRAARHRGDRVIPVRPSKIVCVGRNYVEHAKELGNEVPAEPMLFFKPPSALIGPGEPIVLPRVSQQVEFEAEIGVVIGTPAHGLHPRTRRSGAIGGFVCVNDVTCRDLQKTDGQWGRAKGFDTFCPVGPAGGDRPRLARPRGRSAG